MTKQEFNEHTQTHPYFEIVFTKKNGEKRILHGCLDGERIAAENAVPKSSSNTSNEHIKVYDFVNKGWRTVIVKNIISVHFATNPEGLELKTL